jgi:hypothetical protein
MFKFGKSSINGNLQYETVSHYQRVNVGMEMDEALFLCEKQPKLKDFASEPTKIVG